MIKLKPVYIEAQDLSDAWFQCIWNILDYGRRYKIDEGSFIGQTRLQFDHVTIYIKQPYAEPYERMLPEIPSHYNIPNPVDKDYLYSYIPYLISGEKQQNEKYTYGERIANFKNEETILNQIELWTDRLKKSPNQNQAVIRIEKPDDYLLDDPPCLQSIGLQIHENNLIFYPTFRSNDLWAGFPANLAGLAVMQKLLSENIGVGCGSMIYTSKGLHLYDYCEELAQIRTNRVIL